MTEHTRDGRRLAEVSHTHPFTDESFGATQTYTRGRVLAADGGEARAVGGDADDEGDDGGDRGTTDRGGGSDTAVESAVEPVDDGSDGVDGDSDASPATRDDETLGDVDHTPPRNAPSANPAYMTDDENDER